MALVTIDHPETVGYAVVSEEAFEHIWEELGWVVVVEDPPVPPSSETSATLADIDAAIALLPDIDDVRPGPIVKTRTAADITTANTSGAVVDLDPTGSAASRDLDIVIPAAVAGMWVRLQPRVLLNNTTAVAVNLAFRSIVSGAAVNTYATPVWNGASGQIDKLTAPHVIQLVSGDISGGSARIRVGYLASGARGISSNVVYPLQVEGQVVG